MKQLYSGTANGKLLLTGEYLVLRSAKALAFPAKPGQALSVTASSREGVLEWISKEKSTTWFTATFELPNLKLISCSDTHLGKRLHDLLLIIRSISPDFLGTSQGIRIETVLGFPRDWGLGTSSTLIYLMADWAEIPAYRLLDASFGGSGYDVACANQYSPIFFKREDENVEIETIRFNPPFLDKLYLGFSGIKQDSLKEVSKFLKKGKVDDKYIQKVSQISEMVSKAQDIQDFNKLVEEHESIISNIINVPVAKSQFPDLPVTVKSLGAWGGDFLLFSWDDGFESLNSYLAKKNIGPLFRFKDLLYTGT